MDTKYFKQLNEAVESSNEFSNAIFLYFDIDMEDFWNDEPVFNFFKSLSDLQQIFNEVEELQLYRENNKNPELESKIDSRLNELTNEFRVKIGQISSFYSLAKEQVKGYLKMIREEMKKHEY